MSERVTDEQLEEWRRLTEAATPGRWSFEGSLFSVADSDMEWIPNGETIDGLDLPGSYGLEERCGPDGLFMAAARTAMPALLDEVARLRALLPLARAAVALEAPVSLKAFMARRTRFSEVVAALDPALRTELEADA